MGLPAVTTLRARQDRLGSPQAPEATFTAARVRVLTTPLGSAPDLAHADLQVALEQASAREDEVEMLTPKPRTVAGLTGLEVGWNGASTDGRKQLVRVLLLPARSEVLVLWFRATDGDRAAWERTWTQVSESMALESVPVSSGSPLWPTLPLALAAVALTTALVKRRRTPQAGPSARMEALAHRRTHGDLDTLLPSDNRPPEPVASPAPEPQKAPPASGVEPWQVMPRSGAKPTPAPEPAPVSIPSSSPRPKLVLGGRSSAPVPHDEGNLLSLVDETKEGGMSLLELKLARQNAAPSQG